MSKIAFKIVLFALPIAVIVGCIGYIYTGEWFQFSPDSFINYLCSFSVIGDDMRAVQDANQSFFDNMSAVFESFKSIPGSVRFDSFAEITDIFTFFKAFGDFFTSFVNLISEVD